MTRGGRKVLTKWNMGQETGMDIYIKHSPTHRGVKVIIGKDMTPISGMSQEMTPSAHMSPMRHGGGRIITAWKAKKERWEKAVEQASHRRLEEEP